MKNTKENPLCSSYLALLMPNVYFLFGNDEFAISRKLKDFGSDFTDPTSADMNTAHLDARSMNENDLNNAVNAMPFIATRRLVLLANPQQNITMPPPEKNFSSLWRRRLIVLAW